MPTDEPLASYEPKPRELGVLVGLGALSALWSVALWAELLVARSGGTTFCALSSPDACAKLWDGPFAGAIHRASGLPVAGWGVAWGLAAGVLALIALVRTAERRATLAMLSAVRIVAGAGALAVLVLAAAAVQAAVFCSGCVLTYALVIGYASVALVGWRTLGLPDPRRAAAIAALTLTLAFGLLLYPGLQTPSKAENAGRSSLIDVSEVGRPPAPAPASVKPAGSSVLSSFIASLAPETRQALADSLYIYRSGPTLELGPPRGLLGPAKAPLRITEFTDIRCGHCAELHATLSELERVAPAGSFAVEPRHFPLDGECNAFVRQSSDPVRCLAARAQICTEGRTGAFDYTSRLFRQQATLTVEQVLTLGQAVLPRGNLESCIASAETARKLQTDLELAMRYQIDGTPLVLLNGRRGTSVPAFLYAMTLTGGSDDDPAFDRLPPGNPSAHIH